MLRFLFLILVVNFIAVVAVENAKIGVQERYVAVYSSIARPFQLDSTRQSCHANPNKRRSILKIWDAIDAVVDL